MPQSASFIIEQRNQMSREGQRTFGRERMASSRFRSAALSCLGDKGREAFLTRHAAVGAFGRKRMRRLRSYRLHAVLRPLASFACGDFLVGPCKKGFEFLSSRHRFADRLNGNGKRGDDLGNGATELFLFSTRALILQIWQRNFQSPLVVGRYFSRQFGCIEQHPVGGGSESLAYLVGRIYKMARSIDGDAHRWVAPTPVERAVVVMERLTARLRAQSGQDDLFQAMASTGLVGPAAHIDLHVGSTSIRRLNEMFAPFIGLPDYEGEPWRLNTHQGRKTFARFVGKRDHTGLHTLQAHFGHVTRAMTDRGYVGTDRALDDLIDRHTQEETRAAVEADQAA